MVFQLGTELGLSITDLENKNKCNCDLTAQSKEVLFRWQRDILVRPTIRVLEQALVNSRKGSRCLEEVVKNVDLKTLRAVETITDRIRDNADKIIQDIQISQILDHMMTHLVISADDRRDIEHYPRQDDQNKALLDIVIKRREPSYSVFVDGLRNYGYEDIANDLIYHSQETSSSTTVVSTSNGDKIRDIYSDKIIQDIQISQILDHMMTHLVISADDRRDIEHYPRQDDQNKALLDIVI
ncbi:unnamed protein product [Mytilus edulis]|uniref:CARD domain-containing protein n=1 Tax=Mytilus edulis TaxID=6550 RepID=A0A8S3S749_MYTED|nr:unnamed protein product [Mytilus edulis]